MKQASPTLVERVAQRYLAAALRWKKFPGGAAKIGIIGGPYAKTEDGRFMVYVNRRMQGQPGDRSYAYHFSAVDYSIPDKGQRFTNIPIHMGGGYMTDSNQNVKKVFEAVEKWAHEHPLPAPEPKAARATTARSSGITGAYGGSYTVFNDDDSGEGSYVGVINLMPGAHRTSVEAAMSSVGIYAPRGADRLEWKERGKTGVIHCAGGDVVTFSKNGS